MALALSLINHSNSHSTLRSVTTLTKTVIKVSCSQNASSEPHVSISFIYSASDVQHEAWVCVPVLAGGSYMTYI